MTVGSKTKPTTMPDLGAAFKQAVEQTRTGFNQMMESSFVRELTDKVQSGAGAEEIGQFVLKEIGDLLGIDLTANGTVMSAQTSAAPTAAAPPPAPKV